MNRFAFYFLLATCLIHLLNTQAGVAAQADTLVERPVKTGWTFGALPAVAYNSDEGFRYGALANFFNYGDGTTYPQYLHSLFFEWSRTTKGNGLNNFFYDSHYLIPDTRTTFDLMYLTEQALDFYGFNGQESFYNNAFEDPDDPDFRSRFYYRHERKLLRITADFQRRFLHDDWKWLGGAGVFNLVVGPVAEDLYFEQDIETPQPQGIYDNYVDWGIIPASIREGGTTSFVKAGLMHDTRNQLSNPSRGLWTEAFLLAAPSFLGNDDFSYLQAVFIHRHYITLYPGRLSLANRLGYQGKIAGDMPFYMLPFIYNSYKTYDGFGGAKTVRGVRRNRIQGEGIAYGNFELRYKPFIFDFAGQSFYISTTAFADVATVTQKYPINYDAIAAISPQSDKLHWGTGLALHIAMNENFIVAISYGRALDKNDGDGGLYIGLDFLF